MYYCILTGGRSRRMGQDKAFLELGGKYIVEVLINRFMGEGRKLCLSSSDGDVAGKLTHLRSRPREVADIIREAGPIGGIYSLLKVLGEDIFVMATDMPFADVRLAHLIIAAAESPLYAGAASGTAGMQLCNGAAAESAGMQLCNGAAAGMADLCLLERNNGWLEPLFGFYSQSCLGSIEKMIAQGNYRLAALADYVRVRRIPETDLAKAYGDGWERVLFNMNTPEDYTRAIQIYGSTSGL